MILNKYLKIKYIFKIVYFLFGNYFGKYFYSKFIFNSKYFSKFSSIGWEWLFKCFFWQKILRINSNVQWPVSFKSIIICPENIIFNPDDLNNFNTQGNYFQALNAKIYIGKGTYIAPGVAIITENHDLYNPHLRGSAKDVIIGECSWIGVNSVILPGVELGQHTVVGAGAVVTKSFTEGNCLIAGNPARFIKKII